MDTSTEFVRLIEDALSHTLGSVNAMRPRPADVTDRAAEIMRDFITAKLGPYAARLQITVVEQPPNHLKAHIELPKEVLEELGLPGHPATPDLHCANGDYHEGHIWTVNNDDRRTIGMQAGDYWCDGRSRTKPCVGHRPAPYDRSLCMWCGAALT